MRDLGESAIRRRLDEADPVAAAVRVLANEDSSIAAEFDQEAREEISDRIREHHRSTSLVSRLAAHDHEHLLVEVCDVGVKEGRLVDVGSDWIRLDTPQVACLIPAGAIDSVRGLDSRAPREVPRRSMLLQLDQLVQRHEHVAVATRSDWLAGILAFVGSDHIDVTVSAERVALPIDAIRVIEYQSK